MNIFQFYHSNYVMYININNNYHENSRHEIYMYIKFSKAIILRKDVYFVRHVYLVYFRAFDVHRRKYLSCIFGVFQGI